MFIKDNEKRILKDIYNKGGTSGETGVSHDALFSSGGSFSEGISLEKYNKDMDSISYLVDKGYFDPLYWNKKFHSDKALVMTAKGKLYVTEFINGNFFDKFIYFFRKNDSIAIFVSIMSLIISLIALL